MNDLGIVPKEYRRDEWASAFIPNRTWWMDYQVSPRWGVRRRDGAQVEVDVVRATTGGGPKELVDACIAFDRENPLPFPGFRVGQVWVVDCLQTTFVLGPVSATDLITRLYGRDGDIFRGMLMAYQDSLARRGWGDVIQGLDRVPAIQSVALILDPCRPELAPWTGTPPL